MKKPDWVFVIDSAGTQQRCLGNKLTVTDAGWVKVWIGDTLVGIAKAGEWQRVYLEARGEPKP
jgi:hypothetical protein